MSLILTNHEVASANHSQCVKNIHSFITLRVTTAIPTLITGEKYGDVFFIDNSSLKMSYILYVLLEKNLQMSSLVYDTIPLTTVCI